MAKLCKGKKLESLQSVDWMHKHANVESRSKLILCQCPILVHVSGTRSLSGLRALTDAHRCALSAGEFRAVTNREFAAWGDHRHSRVSE